METEAKEKRAKVRQVKREEEEEWQADLRGNLILVLGHFYRMEQELTRIAESLERRQRQESEQDCCCIIPSFKGVGVAFQKAAAPLNMFSKKKSQIRSID